MFEGRIVHPLAVLYKIEISKLPTFLHFWIYIQTLFPWNEQNHTRNSLVKTKSPCQEMCTWRGRATKAMHIGPNLKYNFLNFKYLSIKVIMISFNCSLKVLSKNVLVVMDTLGNLCIKRIEIEPKIGFQRFHHFPLHLKM